VVSRQVLVLVHWSSEIVLGFKTRLPPFLFFIFFIFHSLSSSLIRYHSVRSGLVLVSFNPLSLFLEDSLLAADLAFTDSLFHPSIDLTANEYFLGSVLANCTVRPCPLVPALLCSVIVSC
jgi:hypothetical protein